MEIKQKIFISRSETKEWYLKAFLQDIKEKPEYVFNNIGKYRYPPYPIHNYEYEGELGILFNVQFVINELCFRDGMFCSFGHYNIENGICKMYKDVRDNPKWI